MAFFPWRIEPSMKFLRSVHGFSHVSVLGILGNGLAVWTEKLKIGGCRNKLTESHKQILHYIILHLDIHKKVSIRIPNYLDMKMYSNELHLKFVLIVRWSD